MKRQAVILGLVVGLILGMSGMAGAVLPGLLTFNNNAIGKVITETALCGTVTIEELSVLVGEPITLPVTSQFNGTWVPTVCYPPSNPNVKGAHLALVYDGKEEAAVYFAPIYNLPNVLPEQGMTVTAVMIGDGPALVYGVNDKVVGVLWRQSDNGAWHRHLISFVYSLKDAVELAKAIEGEK